MRNSLTNNQLRSLAMAMVGAATAAVGTMFVPVAMLEGLTGSTGLSELVPAAAAPLGDTARAMIAFGTGGLTLAILSIVLLRQETPKTPSMPSMVTEPIDLAQEESGLLAKISAKMPWHKGADDIRDLADLPKLRNGDVHPDAPARRPLSAAQDLPTLELSQQAIVAEIEAATCAADVDILSEDPPAVVEAEVAYAPTEMEPAIVVEAPTQAEVVPAHSVQPSIADMVAQLEAAVAHRHRQLAELEAVAATIASERPLPVHEDLPDATASLPELPVADVPEEPILRRPVLEAVPSSPAKDDDIDSALAAALATLHRMNVAAR